MDEKEIRYLAQLSCIRLTERELAGLKADLGRLLDYVGQLNRLPVDKVAPTSAVVLETNRFRDDQPAASLAVDRVMAGAPETEGGFIRVPTVLPGGGKPGT